MITPPAMPAGAAIVYDDLDGLDLFGLPQDRKYVVEDPEAPGACALEVVVDQQGDTPWAFRLRARMDQPIEAGDVLHVRLIARCAFSNTGSARLAVILEQADEPHEKILDLPVTVGTAWQCVDLPVVVRSAMGAGAWMFSIRLGYMPQRVRIACVQVLNFGKSVERDALPAFRIGYTGREPDADWRAAAAERIDRHRKGDLRVSVVDAAGRPIAGASVRARLNRHAFGFGTCVSMTVLKDDPDAERYRQTLQTWFNHAVIENELKWPAIEGHQYANSDRLVDWLNAHHIPTRGHCLLWPSERYLPKSVVALASDPVAFRDRICRHIADTVSRYRGKLIDWDVVNEPYAHHFAMDVLGGNAAMVEWFMIAHEHDPDCRLYINDYEILASGDMLGTPHQEHYYRTVCELLERGAPLHGVGMQGHFGGNITSPHNLLKILDRFAALGVRIKVTEMDVQIADESLRADYYRDFLITLFSHPAVDAVMQWGFWEGSHWIPSSAVLDRSWEVRRHGRVYLDLVHHQWKTDETRATDADGECSLRGIAGDYELCVRVGGRPISREVKLVAGEATSVIINAGTGV